MLEGELVGYKSFVSANECNTGLIVFLNQNIPREVSYYLEQFTCSPGHSTSSYSCNIIRRRQKKCLLVKQLLYHKHLAQDGFQVLLLLTGSNSGKITLYARKPKSSRFHEVKYNNYQNCCCVNFPKHFFLDTSPL